ncbi:hypothetical protein [Pinirhizobacter soli]|uniref:hypothetical protein n=1 Tax=Pinirhizobacter soli TaxID=2786953 RepID=UPI00202A4AB0|nr:hypothetical protein [Pinirhizobacter soli]
MFSSVSSGAPSSLVGNPAPQGIQDGAYPGASPVVSHVGNVCAPGSPRPYVPDGPLTDIYQAEKIDVSADVLQASGNRGLRAAVAFGEVMHLILNVSIPPRTAASLKKIALSLKDAVRTGSVPSSQTLEYLSLARRISAPGGPIDRALRLAFVMVSDTESVSLDELPGERLHLAHLIVLAESTACGLSGNQDGSPGSDEVIGKLAACATLQEAKLYLDRPMDSASPAGQFHQGLEFVRDYLRECFSNPECKPYRFPVASPWKDAMDSFPLPANSPSD